MSSRRRPRARSIKAMLSCALSAALIGGSIAAAPLSASAAPLSVGGGGGHTRFEPGRYIVTLVDDAVASYAGGIAGFEATTPMRGDQLDARRDEVRNYRSYLHGKQRDLAAKVGAEIVYSYTLALNGFSATLDAAQAAALAADKSVAAITPDERKHVTAESSTEFLGLEGTGGVWAEVGGVASAGDGVVVGVLDTGIAPEHPSFAGAPLGTTAGAEPYLSGETITFAKSDGQSFTGTCQTGAQFTADDCSTKIVGARYYVDGFGAGSIGDASTGTGEFLSPRDGDGHGSHTASTAAGNAAVAATVDGTGFGDVSGVAPAAKIAMYKVCWSGPDPGASTDDGCATSDLIAGIDQAVADGVDVINYSIGGGAAQTTYSPTDDAFLGAAAAGIFVSASAGNDGPDASTLDNAAPWITTVAASTIPSYEATVTLGDGQAFAGASVTVDLDPAAAPLAGSLVAAASLAASAEANLCAPGSLDPALVQPDAIVVCERGVYDRVAKSAEVARVGGIGMILLNVTPGSIDIDSHSVPTVHLDAQYHDAVLEYAATPGATASFRTGNSTPYIPPVPQVAGFSSRGPVLADGSDILKPDIAAPGVSILAAGPNQEGGEPSFRFLSGTSMAAPHIAGLAALYLGERPNASPAEVKSAMMTTAHGTLDGVGAEIGDPFAEGAGHVDPTSYFEPGLLYLSGVPDWLAYLQGIGYDAGVEPIDASDLNLPSIAVGTLTAPETVTRTVTATQSGTFDASVSGLEGIDVAIEPSALDVVAGESYDYTVTFSRTTAALDEFATGAIDWTSGETVAHSPVAVRPVSIVAPAEATGEGTSGSASVTVTPGGDGEIALSSTGLSLGTVQEGAGVTGEEFEYAVSVPRGALLARFDLDAIAEAVDFDLVVYQLDAKGQAIAGWQSASGAADERIDLAAPEAGDYLVLVSVYSAEPATDFELTTTSVLAGGEPLTLDPTVLAGAQGEDLSYTASWSGLEPNSSYLGLVGYGDTGVSTAVSVQTGALPAPQSLEPPTISGQPVVGRQLKAGPGSWDTRGLTFGYRWQRDGVDIPGATSARYKVVAADRGTELTVVVTATKEGHDPGTASSAPVAVP